MCWFFNLSSNLHVRNSEVHICTEHCIVLLFLFKNKTELKEKPIDISVKDKGTYI